MSTQNDLQKRIKKGKQNIGLFGGLVISMSIAAVFLSFAVGVKAPGVWMSASLAGVFCGLLLASMKRVQHLEARLTA